MTTLEELHLFLHHPPIETTGYNLEPTSQAIIDSELETRFSGIWSNWTEPSVRCFPGMWGRAKLEIQRWFKFSYLPKQNNLHRCEYSQVSWCWAHKWTFDWLCCNNPPTIATKVHIWPEQELQFSKTPAVKFLANMPLELINMLGPFYGWIP